MGRRLAALGVVALLAAACSDSAAPSSTTVSIAPSTTIADGYTEFGCESAPVGQRGSMSSIPLALIPYPVTAGASVRVEIGATEENSTMVGWGVDWQCWDGSAWMGTHQLGFGLDAGGDVVPVRPGATTTIPAIGYMVPQRDDFFVTIPNVPPGWYRLSVRGIGYLAVEVVAG